jgi:hypothetical protein
MARIGLYLVSIERQSYLLAKMLALAGSRVFVYSEVSLQTVLAGTESPSIPERRYFSWLFSDKDIVTLGVDEEAPRVDLLIYEMGHPWPAQPERLSAWICRASYVAAFHNHEQISGWYQNQRADFARLIKYGRFLRRTRRFLLRGGRAHFRLPLVLARGARLGYFVNPEFLRDSKLREAMFAADWSPQGKRPVRLLFAGNPEPLCRRKIVERLTEWLTHQPGWPVISSLGEWKQGQEAFADAKQAILWMVRGDPNDLNWESRADSVAPERWPAVLSLADFSLCPPGYEPKTHRVIESLLRGSIPILDCPELYDLGLGDEANCIVVRNNDWVGAVAKALSFTSEKVVSMREAVRKCRDQFLTLDRAGQHLAGKCGLEIRASGFHP